MGETTLYRMRPLSLKRSRITGGFWAERMEVNRKATLPIEYEQCKKTGRIDAWKLEWKPGQPNPPHIFWGSDSGKWIEAVAYSLAAHPDKELERLADGVIDLIEKAQQPDGYLNIHFTVVEPEKRWTNLRDCHELYGAGHLIEAAVAYYEATGKRKLLDVLCRYADHIDRTFGPNEGQKRGYCGHEEIELALVRLYYATGEKRYLDLARYFIDERGRQPHYFDIEARQRGDDPKKYRWASYDYNQSHAPVREQSTAEGHAVRAGYLYSGMASVAAETGDRELLKACQRLWKNITLRRMYIHGGIGSSRFGERFSYDYDLPNEEAYAETCAAIALVFFAHRMLQTDPDARYADVMERALYNGVISGVSLDGKQFFYDNVLAVDPPYHKFSGQKSPQRQDWFGCACCPPNLARLLASLPSYVYSQGKDGAWIHLYATGRGEFEIAGQAVAIEQRTDYPWKEKVLLTVAPEKPAVFSVALRIPGWCRGAKLAVNGKPIKASAVMKKGYAIVRREWKAGDRVELTLPMPVERIEAHPRVRHDAGRIALQRGPIVYCLEEMDNGKNLNDLVLPRRAKLRVKVNRRLFGGIPVITAKGRRRDAARWGENLYRPVSSRTKSAPIKAVPYFAWANRGLGEMLVWLRCG